MTAAARLALATAAAPVAQLLPGAALTARPSLDAACTRGTNGNDALNGTTGNDVTAPGPCLPACGKQEK